MMKTRDVKTPQRGTAGSAGYDFFVPNDFEQITLERGQDALIPSGIRCQIPKNHALLAVAKSGVATKKKLGVGACLVDEDYTGEIHLHVYNWSNTDATISAGEKLVQFILTPVVYADVEIVENIDFEATERGEGGFGSTGNGVEETPLIKRKPGVAANLVRKDPMKESLKTGVYTRHYFRSVDDTSKEYILDVTNMTKACFKGLEIGDTFMGLHTFMHTNGKSYINGKQDAEYLGKIGAVRDQLVKPKKPKATADIFATFSSPRSGMRNEDLCHEDMVENYKQWLNDPKGK